jgi:hypothetical protein
VGRQYGSEGKGNIAGHIAPEYDLLLGAGAGGHVETHDGRVAWIEIFHNGHYTLGGQSGSACDCCDVLDRQQPGCVGREDRAAGLAAPRTFRRSMIS